MLTANYIERQFRGCLFKYSPIPSDFSPKIKCNRTREAAYTLVAVSSRNMDNRQVEEPQKSGGPGPFWKNDRKRNQHTAWNNNTYMTSHKALINPRTQVRASEGGSLTVVSTEGIGRAVMYAAIDATLTCLFKGVMTRLLDVIIQLRRQRAHNLCYQMAKF